MARIRRYRSARGTYIKVSGRLTAGDMGRFERACGPALTTPEMALVIDMTGVTDTDHTADALVRRMEQRGARIDHGTIAAR